MARSIKELMHDAMMIRLRRAKGDIREVERKFKATTITDEAMKKEILEIQGSMNGLMKQLMQVLKTIPGTLYQEEKEKEKEKEKEPICTGCGNKVYTHVPHYCDNDPVMDKAVQGVADDLCR